MLREFPGPCASQRELPFVLLARGKGREIARDARTTAITDFALTATR